jgi:hypothetical protein
MREGDLTRWFQGYLDAFAALGRGVTDDTAALLRYYNVPLLLTSDDGCFPLTSEEQVVVAAQQQVDGMRATDYDHSEVLDFAVEVLNASSALYRGAFSRRRSDGSEITSLAVTYLIADGPIGRRISALAVHSPGS